MLAATVDSSSSRHRPPPALQAADRLRYDRDIHNDDDDDDDGYLNHSADDEAIGRGSSPRSSRLHARRSANASSSPAHATSPSDPSPRGSLSRPPSASSLRAAAAEASMAGSSGAADGGGSGNSASSLRARNGANVRPLTSYRPPLQEKRSFPKLGDNGGDSSSAYDTDHRTPDHPGAASSSQEVTMLVNEPFAKKWRNWWVRTFWTLVMVGGFVGILLAGHIWVVLLVVVIQTMVYKEVISIAHIPSKQKKMPWFRTMNWYFLLSTNYYLYGQTIIQYFKQSIFVDALGVYLATHHQFISFTLYVIGFVAFVMNLQKGHYKFQFTQFAWTHMTLLLVVVQSQFIVKNIFEGLVWFILPTSLVICNDISAYISGFFFGRTPLIRLSPKKTWEGFIGALIATVVFAFFFSGFIVQFPYFTCPVRNMKTSSMSGVTCIPNPVFVTSEHQLAPPLRSLLWHVTGKEFQTITFAPFQLHSIVMALFASLIAPFGGFFASGAKRAFKLKDFGDSIPGHGGITDRMDCQFLMSFFSYMYFQTFIGIGDVTVGQVLQLAVAGLQPKDQLELFYDFRDYLIQQGLLDAVEAGSSSARRPLLSTWKGT
ncbi:hypothetical protein HDU96_007512 [Phlyctochytrium bullatum]|nr:hypothetical protein HDU96_007512 [Phlyctochytrium bullatum]